MYDDLTPQERLNRITEILMRGIYLYAEQKGWVKECKEDRNSIQVNPKQKENSNLKHHSKSKAPGL